VGELWPPTTGLLLATGLQVPYPLISLVTRMPQTLQGFTPVAFRCRTFEAFTLSFAQEQEASDVFESVRELTVASALRYLHSKHY
jgi:myotubularin-related protein 6/7/8